MSAFEKELEQLVVDLRSYAESMREKPVGGWDAGVALDLEKAATVLDTDVKRNAKRDNAIRQLTHGVRLFEQQMRNYGEIEVADEMAKAAELCEKMLAEGTRSPLDPPTQPPGG